MSERFQKRRIHVATQVTQVRMVSAAFLHTWCRKLLLGKSLEEARRDTGIVSSVLPYFFNACYLHVRAGQDMADHNQPLKPWEYTVSCNYDQAWVCDGHFGCRLRFRCAADIGRNHHDG